MHKPKLFASNNELKVLCLGAHPDDIEIGCGGTLLRIAKEVPKAQFYWVVFSGNSQRQKETIESAQIFLNNVTIKKVVVKDFRDSYFPFIGEQIKDYFEQIKQDFSPDIIFTHYRNDAHQDHRLISNLTWNTFRDHLLLEYEIPKFDGDLGTPNLYVNIDETLARRKTSLILENYPSQKEKSWFTAETFMSILRIRGIESNSPTQYAEGFYCRKLVI
ncbi:MAG TPA: PIG-L deacetylase family protein [Candidatus Nanoarchaeia archaeon]|nr:PIG-L deacetylase family protein [Candidatus Nanoarchaeia archaeon]